MELSLRRPPNDNEDILKENNAFMNRNDHDQAARDVLIAEAKSRGLKTKGELIRWARKHGYLKTARDRDVLNDVLFKLQLPEDLEYDRLADEVEQRQKDVLNRARRGIISRKGNVTKQWIRDTIENEN